MDIAPEVRKWLRDGRDDIALFALQGLGIELHPRQVEAAQAILAKKASYFTLDWANRSGKTTLLCVLHFHQLWYKYWLDEPDRKKWRLSEYATLHSAPLGEIAGRAHLAMDEMTKGTHRAQRDLETGQRRPSPLAPFYRAVKERDRTGADHMVLKCITGGQTDFRSTEGRARRIEGGAWWLISWDEWPQTEGDPDEIRYILDVRLTARAADFEAPIILTGTRNEDTEHIAKEWDTRAEDPTDEDWWGNHASRMDNPAASLKSIEIARRNLAPEDFARSVLGIEGGARGRVFPSFLVDPVFDEKLPRLTRPHPLDGRDVPHMASPWTYLHIWDLALAAAENVGAVWRIPHDWKFSPADPITGVRLVRIPGSRTLTPAEIMHTIEETFLPYGGLIVLDTTDAHGKGIFRELRGAGYPVEAFTFNERVGTRIRRVGSDFSMIRKDRGIKHARELLSDGLAFEYDTSGDPVIGRDEVVKLDLSEPYGSLRLPASWTVVRDQLSLLKVDDFRQRKDAAMTVLMGADVAMRRRNAATRGTSITRLAVMGG